MMRAGCRVRLSRAFKGRGSTEFLIRNAPSCIGRRNGQEPRFATTRTISKDSMDVGAMTAVSHSMIHAPAENQSEPAVVGEFVKVETNNKGVVLLGKTREEMNALVLKCDAERYRADQIFTYLLRGVRSVEDMNYIPRILRERLLEMDARTGRSQIYSQQRSSDGTIKFLLQLKDGIVVETVAIPSDRGDKQRLTTCVSSQVGCALKCTFCATGLGGAGRNLKANEIIDQVLTVQEEMGRHVTNVVFMGMGEPLLNLNEVLKAYAWINEHIGIAARSFTISTVGVPNGIRLLAEKRLQLTLAVSLHAPNQTLREQLVPSAKEYPVSRLFSDCRWYFNRTGRRITFEYTLLKGVNDSEDDARKLAKTLLKNKVRNHVNLMLWNKVDGINYERPEWETAVKFKEILEFYAIPATIRKSRGLEKSAACGQLSNAFQKRPLKDFVPLT